MREPQFFNELRKEYLSNSAFPFCATGNPPARNGAPNHVWTRKEGKKTVSKRTSASSEIEQARKDAAGYTRFKELCREQAAG